MLITGLSRGLTDRLCCIHYQGFLIECFHMTSRRPYWCPKTMKRWPCWCPKLILWELNSFLTQTHSFVPMNLHRCWPREWKHSILKPSRETLHPHLLEHLSKTHTWNWSHTLIPLFTISYLEVNIKRTAVRTLFNPNTSTLKADNEKSSEVLLRLIYSSQVYLVTV